ncbi:MAG: diaminopimelate epimerase [Flavobacteriales bacterium]|nr:diaminopimelate epimerase [Flavobacteriales bacterium]
MFTFAGDMLLQFYKYQGTGNDFIIIDDRTQAFNESAELVQRLCDRRFGIGSDGVMLIRPSDRADLHLDFLNPDGTRSFCGNGSRCGIRFAHSSGMIGDTCSFEAVDGIHQAKVEDSVICISMKDVDHIHSHSQGTVIHTGSPHLLLPTEDVENVKVKEEGSSIRYSDDFREEGINVNFIQINDERSLDIRTYERGVEDETLSCGTGVTAAAIYLAELKQLTEGPIHVRSRGGDLEVDFKKRESDYVDIWLLGPAERVYEGSIEI